MKEIVEKIKQKIYKLIRKIRNIETVDEIQHKRVEPWFKINGDKTLRLDYELDSFSIVVDVGGYEGQWSSDIFSKYCCSIFIFEPVEKFYEEISSRFKYNNKIKVYKAGLSSEDKDIKISLLNDSSSLFKSDENTENIKILDASIFFIKNNIKNIDLIKINIEGSEYELLENLISNDIIKNIHNIQVQFHDFVPNAKERMEKIQTELLKTHHLTYQYEFVWENWEINKNGK